MRKNIYENLYVKNGEVLLAELRHIPQQKPKITIGSAFSHYHCYECEKPRLFSQFQLEKCQISIPNFLTFSDQPWFSDFFWPAATLNLYVKHQKHWLTPTDYNTWAMRPSRFLHSLWLYSYKIQYLESSSFIYLMQFTWKRERRGAVSLSLSLSCLKNLDYSYFTCSYSEATVLIFLIFCKNIFIDEAQRKVGS